MINERDSEIMEAYTNPNMLESWDTEHMKEHPYLRRGYRDTLVNADVLPSESKVVDYFVLYSPSSNQGSIERFFAMCLEHNPSVQNALIVGGDMFGKEVISTPHTNSNEGIDGGRSSFIPGFAKQSKDIFTKVKFERVAATARSIPLEDHSVDVVWDRLGALWYVFENCALDRKMNAKSDVETLLTEYKRVLKSGGKLVIDASDQMMGNVPSTYRYSKGTDSELLIKFGPVNFEELGWNVTFAGDGETKVAILQPAIKSL